MSDLHITESDKKNKMLYEKKIYFTKELLQRYCVW